MKRKLHAKNDNPLGIQVPLVHSCSLRRVIVAVLAQTFYTKQEEIGYVLGTLLDVFPLRQL
jgi:hypothetical protein